MKKIKDFILHLSVEEKTAFRTAITDKFFTHRISYYRWLETPVNRLNLEKISFIKENFNIDITSNN
jgi:hypothetical protein